MQTHTDTRARPRQRPSRTNADRRFGKYRKEDHRLVRPADVKPRDLRKRREMLRRMTPEQALAVIEFYQNLTLFEAFELAKSQGRLVVPNNIHDWISTEVDEQTLREVYQHWTRTGTLVIYEAPNKPFGRFVGYFKIVFEVPKQFRGKVNCALAVDHPDFEIVETKVIVSDPANIHLVENLPSKNQSLYLPHAETGIPQGNEVEYSDEARYLLAADGHSIGTVRRVLPQNPTHHLPLVDLFDVPSSHNRIALF